MILAVVTDVAKLLLIAGGLFLALRMYLRHQQPTWSAPVERRRLVILLVLVLAVSAIKVSEDALSGESGPVDEVILLFVHTHMPSRLTGFFEWVTVTGSFTVLAPLTTAAAIGLLYARRRFDALLLTASVVGGAAVVYVVKWAAGRTRPTLWETEWYWGSSFPSGHTLVVTAFATAAALGVNRGPPPVRRLAWSAAVCWISLVALSRMALGVHWPTDVFAAVCIGAVLPLAIHVAIEVLRT